MNRIKSIIRFVVTILSFFWAITSNAQVKIPAFPGAEGHARYITGGRGGEIRHVTNLNDSGSGSLREALKGNNAKTIVFDVSGYIDLQSQLDITSNTTIAGQTAPSPGITLRYYTVYFGKCDNVIVRYIRFRRSQVKDVNDGADATWGRRRNQIMLDHCSFSWSIDEVASFYDNNNFTMQWCTVGEAQNDAGHGKGNHGYGGIWGGKLASFHHNLLIHLNNRVPRFNGARYNWGDYTKNMYYDQYKWENSIQAETVDLRNCVMYNWGNGNGCYGGPGGGYINIVNNYYKAGPGTKNTKTVTQVSVGASGNSTEGDQIGMTSRYYISGNYVTAAGDKAANYDWKGVTIDAGTFAIDGEKYSKDPKHFYGDTVIYKQNANGEDCIRIKVDGPCPIGDITTHSAETTYEKVLAYAGASLYRDAVDARFMEETKLGTITYTGTKTGIKGIVDIINNPVGIQDDSCPSFPQLISQSRPNGYDSDGDGIPDTWEITNGLSPYNASDANSYTIDKSKGWYTNLEVYMNALVENIMKAENADAESSINEYYPVCKQTESETVVITAKSYSREYGEPNPSFGYTKEGSIINGTPNIYCEATVSSPVGTYPIKISKGSITNSSVEYIDGTLTITKASLTVTANSYTRAEGEDNPSFGVTYSGFKNGETEAILTRNPTVTTSATTSSGPGTYDINVSGAEAQNYTFNYVKGTLTVTESSNVTFTNGGITYNGVKALLTAEVTSFDQSKSSVTIPETVSFDGRTYRVTSIGKFAFYQCRNVLSVTIPNSVTSIGSSAFEDCSALTSVSLGSGLSSIGGSAFEDCTSLSTITLPATVTSIALNAFKNCSNLKNVTSEIQTPFAIQDNVFEGIASGATLTVPKGTKTAYQSTAGWNKFTKIIETTSGIDDPATQYFTFVTKEKGTFSFSGTSSDKVDNSVIYYSLDSGASWTALARNVQSPTIQAGKRIMFKGTLTPLYYEVNNGEAIVGIGGFSSTGRFDVEGNIMSLLFGDNFIGKTNLTGKDHTFYELFLDCTGLINAGNLVLPATTLAENCYEGMFRNCTSLTIAPQLPATKLPNCCYEGMFYNCTSLTTAPQLLATSLGISCYSHMFGLCTSLSIAPKLPAVALAEKCYRSMFRGCMSLTKAPQLPATTLTSQCYEYMFAGCASLKEITCLATNISASDCTGNWLSDVASTGTFTKSSSMNSWPRGVNGIPTNWTIQNDNGSSTNEVTINSISYVVDNSTFTAEVKSVDNSLRSVNIPESINYNGTEYRVTSLAERSFEGRDDITYLSIPSSINSIGEYAFLDCGSNIMVNIESLEAWCKVKFGNKHSCPLSCAKSFCLNDVEVKSLSIPSGVTSISSYAFYQCRSITSLSIPNTVTSISSSVFEDCTGLTSVSLGNGLTSIGGSAFEDCTSLSAITLPATVTSIALNAFRNCSNLKNVSSEIQTPFAIQDNVFEGIASDATLTVPKGTKSAYQSTAGWNKFTKITESTNGGDGMKVELEALSYSREYGEGNPVFDYKINTEEGEQFLWNGSETYGESWSLRNIDVTTGIGMFISGDRLRFYVTNIGVNAWMTIVIGNTKPYLVDGAFPTDGSSYLEVVLDEEKADQLNSHISGGRISFQIQGRSFTLEGISKCMSFELNGEPTISCEASASSPVGTYPIKISKGSISNDNVTYVDGTLTITKAPLTITAKNCSKEQGQENPFFEVTYSGFKNGENESVLTRKPTISTTATASSGPGTYDINVSGAEAQNYSLTYNKGVLTVTEKDEVAFTIDGTTYQGSKSEKTVMVKSVDTSRTWMEIPASVSYDGRTYQVTGIDNDVFKGSSMAALIWDVEAVLPNNAFGNASIGSNFLLYVNSSSYAPSSVKNVVVNGTAQTIVLSDDGGQFYCPQTFTARSISYTHNYSMETDIGKAKGWETLTLPFDVQNISHNTRGEIVPFPSFNGSSNQKPFWLANFSGNGFRRTAAVLANEPYIIAMPNSSSYRNEYNLAGDVTFSADNVQVPKTPSFSGTFVPAFGTVPQSSTVYALNVNNRHVKYSGNYDAGSRFIANLRDVRPFEAYISNSSTRGIIEISFDDGTTDMFDILLPTDESQEVTIHTLSGQQVDRTTQRDFDAVWQQLPKGVYIINGKKWIK